MNINLINELQAGVIISLVLFNLALYGGFKLGSSQWYLGINAAMISFIITFHGSLLWFEITPLLYLWFWLAILHFYIHAYNAKFTIVETKRVTYDEAWHFLNQSSVLYYMYTHDIDRMYIEIYAGFIVTYLFLLVLFLDGYKWSIDPLYYLGSFMELYFIYTICPSPLYEFLIAGILHMTATWIITFNNRLGRYLILCDIAGCAFLSEFLILYLVHNNIYISC